MLVLSELNRLGRYHGLRIGYPSDRTKAVENKLVEIAWFARPDLYKHIIVTVERRYLEDGILVLEFTNLSEDFEILPGFDVDKNKRAALFILMQWNRPLIFLDIIMYRLA